MKVSNFFAATDIVVVDTNPEMADMDNPRGEFFGSAAFVYAEDDGGNRRRTYVTTRDSDAEALEVAKRMAEALNARLAAGKLPIGFNRWDDARPAYGSDAYVAYGQADDLELERMEG